MSFLELCKPDYFVEDKDLHKTEFINAITNHLSAVIDEIKTISNYHKIYFYQYLARYCPQAYLDFLPDLIEDFVLEQHSHYVNDVSRMLFSRLTREQQAKIAYPVLLDSNRSYEVKKRFIEFLYDDATQQHAGLAFHHEGVAQLKTCLEKMRDLYQGEKIIYEVELYLCHLNSVFHQAEYISSLPVQPSLFPYPNHTQFWTRLTYRIHYLVSMHVIEDLYDVEKLSPKTIMCLLQFATEYTNPALAKKAQHVLSAHPALATHLTTILNSAEITYKKRVLKWLNAPECQIQIAQQDLISLLKKDQSKRLSPYIYLLFLKYKYDLTGYFDRATLIEDAKKLCQKTPVSLQWLSPDDLAQLYWNDGQEIDKTTIYGWLCQAASVTDLTQHEAFQLYLNFLNRDSQITLAHDIMQKFIEQDLLSSAAKCKGILVFTTPLPLDEHVNYLQNFFKQAQQHVPQLKAMLETLLRNETDYILYLLNAKGFAKKPVIDQYRIELLNLLVPEYGISLAENFDQLFTPTLGFNPLSECHYHYQNKDFILTITPEFKLVFNDSNAKKISKLPKPKNSDEEIQWQQINDEIAEKNQALNTLVKELKTRYKNIRTPYNARFYYKDWLNLMFNHPILRHISSGVVWEASTPSKDLGQCIATMDGHFVDHNLVPIEHDQQTLFRISERANWREDWELKWKGIFIEQQRTHLWHKMN